jgi:hypothetical protein
MNHYFFKKVNLRNRMAMIMFLKNHFRYNTANSWNRSTSYAHNVKIYNLGLTDAQLSRAWDLINQDQVHSRLNVILTNWSSGSNYSWQAAFNKGYIVLYQGGLENLRDSYKSFCSDCGQGNYKRVPVENPTPEERIRLIANLKNGWINSVIYSNYADEISALGFSEKEAMKLIVDEKWQLKHGKDQCSVDNRCGKCGEMTRENYDKMPRRSITYTMRSTDMSESFEDWDISSLRERVRLVQAFDYTCDLVRESFIYCCDHYEVKEIDVMVPAKRKILVNL